MASSDNNNGDMLKQAQHIWTMLDELADSDPAAYKKFLDKNMKESKEVMTPAKQSMCVSTRILRPNAHTLFVNICSWSRLPKPKADEDPIGIAGGPLEEGVDGKESYKVVRLAVNPEVLDECCRHTEEKDLLIQLGFQYLEKSHSIGISRQYTVLKDTKYKGDPTVLLKNFYLKKDDVERKAVDDFMSNLTNMSPDSLLSQLGKISTGGDDDSISKNITNSDGNNSSPHPNITMATKPSCPSKPGLIEELSSEDVKLEIPDHNVCLQEADERKPRRLVVRVTLPEVTSVNGCELDITEDEISLSAADIYSLELTLPEMIDESKANAKFSSKTSQLTITLPTIEQPSTS